MQVLKRQVVEVPARSATRAEMEAVNREIADMKVSHPITHDAY
jgi:hypothetical protein